MKNEFECKFYGGGEEFQFLPGHTALEMTIEVLDRLDGEECPDRYVTWLPTTEGISLQFNGEHVGNIKPVYPNEAKVAALHEMFRLSVVRRYQSRHVVPPAAPALDLEDCRELLARAAGALADYEAQLDEPVSPLRREIEQALGA